MYWPLELGFYWNKRPFYYFFYYSFIYLFLFDFFLERNDLIKKDYCRIYPVSYYYYYHNNLYYYYYYYYLFSFESFSHQCKLMVSHWSLSDNKYPQVSRTLLSILTNLNNTIARPVISKSSSLVSILSDCIEIANCVIFMFHSFFNSLARSLSLFPHSFNFTLWSAGTAKSHNSASSLFRCVVVADYYIRSRRLAEIWWSVCNSKSQWNLSVSFSRDRFWIVHIPFVRLIKLQLLAQLPVDHHAHPIVPRLIFFLC